MEIVYIADGMTSTLHSSLELSRRLAAAGHQVTYLSPADIGSRVEAAGWKFIRLAADDLYAKEAAALAPIRWRDLIRPLRWLRTVAARRRLRRRSAAEDEIERLVSELRPDLLLVDVEMHFAIVATARLGIPTLLTMVFFSIFRRPGLPPLNTKLPAPENASQRLRCWLTWQKLRLATSAGEWRRRLARWRRGGLYPPISFATFERDDLALVARARGESLRHSTSRAHWLRPHVYRNLPVLSFNALELELPHQPHPDMVYVGPMVLQDPPVGGGDDSDRWQRFALERRAMAEPPRLIYCSLGTFWSTDLELLRRVVRVFERRGDWQLVLGLGGRATAADLSPLPANVLALGWAPQVEVLQMADCAIVHGGNTSLNECLWFGVPMVVYSTGHVDQDGNTARVAHHRVGVVGDRSRDGDEELEQNIARALDDPQIAASVESLRKHLLAHAQNGTAVRRIEQAAGR